MEVSEDVWNMVNTRGAASGFLATADADGMPNVAVYGSLRMPERGKATMIMSETRTLANLRENPYAAFITATGTGPADVKGHRLYLKVAEIKEDGPAFDAGYEMVRQAVSQETADLMVAAVVFEVIETRPVVDMG